MNPGKRTAPEGTGANADTRPEQPPERIAQEADEEDPGFFAKALSGKVRPAPREPEITHYGCPCCRWSA
jgi:hypothetical protein